MRDSCVANRKNNWPRRPDCSALPGGSASSTSAATCNAVFKTGPPGDFALAATTPASGFDSGNICNPGGEGFFFIVYDDAECNPGKTPPAPKLVATTGAKYRGPSCNRAAFSSGSSYRGGGGGGLTAPARTGVGIGTALLILLLAGGACAAVFFMFKKSQANQAGAGAGAGGVQMGGAPSGGGGALPPPPPPPPPGSYFPGAPAAGAAARPAGAAGAGAPGGVQYSFAPGKGDGGKATTTAAATAASAAPPAGSKPSAATSSASVPLPGGSDAVAGAGKPPGGVSYPKV